MQTTGIILAGGRSSRLKRNKALIVMNGKRIIEIIYSKIKSLLNEVIIISDNPEDYFFMKIKVCKDIYTGMGPLAGIHSGLINSNTERNLVISCDLPLISAEAAASIISFNSPKPVVLYRQNMHTQYLFGIYSKKCIPAIENSLHAGSCRIRDFIMKTEAEIVETSFPEEIFFNLNTPEDLRVLKSMETTFFNLRKYSSPRRKSPHL